MRATAEYFNGFSIGTPRGGKWAVASVARLLAQLEGRRLIRVIISARGSAPLRVAQTKKGHSQLRARDRRTNQPEVPIIEYLLFLLGRCQIASSGMFDTHRVVLKSANLPRCPNQIATDSIRMTLLGYLD